MTPQELRTASSSPQIQQLELDTDIEEPEYEEIFPEEEEQQTPVVKSINRPDHYSHQARFDQLDQPQPLEVPPEESEFDSSWTPDQDKIPKNKINKNKILSNDTSNIEFNPALKRVQKKKTFFQL